MAYHNETERRSKVASIDLDTALFHAVDLTSTAGKITIAAANGGYGILANKPKAGEDAAVIVEGETEVRVGAAVSPGDWLVAAASGWLVSFVESNQVASGSVLTSRVIMGRAQTGAASGMLATADIDPFITTVHSI